MRLTPLSYVFFLCCLPTFCAIRSDAQPGSEGLYSREAKPIWDRIAGSLSPLAIPAPDRQSTAIAKYVETNGEGRVFLLIQGRLGSATIDLGPGVGSELLWAPGSNALFITTSDQGANGSYRTLVIARFAGQLQSRDLTPLVVKSFGHPVRCVVPEGPNVGGVFWNPDSKSLIVAAEIVNHSNCDRAGTFRLFQVNPWTMTVPRSFGQLEAKRQFGSKLGMELSAASDECIRRPAKCRVAKH